MFTRAPATERLHNRAGGSLAETTHLGRLGGIGGSSLRPAPHTAPCSRTPCATPRMTTIYVHIPLGSDGNCLHPVRQAFLCFRKRGAAPRSVPRGLAEHLSNLNRLGGSRNGKNKNRYGSSDRKRMHAHRGPPFVSANTGTADFVQNVTAPNSRGISRVCVIWEATSTIAVCSLVGGVRPRR